MKEGPFTSVIPLNLYLLSENGKHILKVQEQLPEVFCKISQNSQKQVCVGVSFLKKLQFWGLLNF